MPEVLLRRPRTARVWGAVLLMGYVAVRAALEARYQLFDPDEALEMLAAGSLREGKLPYLGALSHRGPFLTVLYGLPCALFGPNAYRAVHAFAVLLFVLVGAWFQRCVARATSERIGLLALSNLLLLATVRIPAEDNWSLNSDFLMAGLATVAMCLLLSSRDPSGPSRPTSHTGTPSPSYTGVGLVLALAFLTKQNAAPYLAVPLAYIVCFDKERALRKLGSLAGGFAAPLVVVALTYLAKGQLDRAWYFFYEYNRSYAAAAYVHGPLATAASSAAWLGRSYGELLGLAAVGAIAFARRRDSRHAATWFVAGAWALTGIVAAVLPGKHWDNYLWASHAPVALLAALAADLLLERTERWGRSTRVRRAVAACVVAVPLLGCISQLPRGLHVLTSATEVGGIPPPRVPRRELVALITRFARDDETLYVTGYAPEMYVLSARRPASRHVISNFVETVYPGRFDVPSRIAPGFLAELREDLRASRPRVILDACALGFLCHPSSALTAVLPTLLDDYHPLPEGPPGVFIRND
jgi:branched-subunit amino acid transport protein